MHEQSLASAKPAAREDIVEDGEIGFRQACRINCAQGLWELCGILGDGVNQAADFFSNATSIPSLNVTPPTIFGN